MNPQAVESQADSLMEILAAQCADLEALLALARREAGAAERRDFDEMMRVARERATLGERLEVYHRQVAEMRLRMGSGIEPALRSEVATRTALLAVEVQAQDARTRPLLMAARHEKAHEISDLSTARRGVSAYLRDGRFPAVACNQMA